MVHQNSSSCAAGCDPVPILAGKQPGARLALSNVIHRPSGDVLRSNIPPEDAERVAACWDRMAGEADGTVEVVPAPRTFLYRVVEAETGTSLGNHLSREQAEAFAKIWTDNSAWLVSLGRQALPAVKVQEIALQQIGVTDVVNVPSFSQVEGGDA